MGCHPFKKHQVSSIAFLCRVLCFIQVGNNSLCRVNLSVQMDYMDNKTLGVNEAGDSTAGK